MPNASSQPAPVTFVDRHVGVDTTAEQAMLAVIGHDSLDALADAAVPASIRLTERLALDDARSEPEVLAEPARAWPTATGC
ncbi:hypothetical protein GCM10025868_45110 [Angustibacter aerolatus]|uniref:Glycine cleavage system P-protein N-terminal domain-containing protein n=1 Tax=Angustibacter aerolatus TaxID=1162965 RepID=A0ABQ6JLW0_9ACTN|nr:hypothetical protein [Angustibacter aerolatus]GMA89261.1 hypothetical protein GCM10025868_45110 [Angustibacter aerolatus]